MRWIVLPAIFALGLPARDHGDLHEDDDSDGDAAKSYGDRHRHQDAEQDPEVDRGPDSNGHTARADGLCPIPAEGNNPGPGTAARVYYASAAELPASVIFYGMASREEELTFNLGDACLAASLTLPRRSPAPALVALHGASDGTREFPLFLHLHETIPPAGVAVLTFDRRGEGASSGEPSRDRFRLQADDALAIVRCLAAEPGIEAARIGLWGFSQGGWVAPLAATRGRDVAFLVLLASTGVTPAEQMRYGVAVHLRGAGYGEDVVQHVTDLRHRVEAHARGEGDDAELRELLQAASRAPWWHLAYLPATLLNEREKQEWVEEMEFDPEPVFARVRVPTLLFYGEDDEWTPVEPSIATWRRARGDAVDVIRLPGTGHEPTLADGTISSEYEQALRTWLAKASR